MFVNKYMKLLTLVAASVLTNGSLAETTGEPIPSFYQEPGVSRTREYTNQHPQERIDPFTGKLQWHAVDLFVPGNGGLDIKVQRSYSSRNYNGTVEVPFEESSPVGLGWTMHFGRVLRKASTLICDLTAPSTRNPVLELPDGSRQVLYPALDGPSFISPGLWKAECSRDVPGLIVHSPDGTRYDMTTGGASYGGYNPWYVTRITDRNGNWLSINYALMATGGAAVTSISASDGRSVSFNYTSGNGVPMVLRSVESGGVTWNYVQEAASASGTSVTGLNNLVSVQRPDGTAWQYEYEKDSKPGALSLKRVTYPTGGTIDYTYGYVQFAGDLWAKSTVVTQKAADPWANGAPTTQVPPTEGKWIWTYSYTPATQPIPYVVDANGNKRFSNSIPPSATAALSMDQTHVKGPGFEKTYYHFGYVSASPGFVYLIGSLLGTASPIQVDAYSYWPMTISNQPNMRPYNVISDDETSIPLMTAHGMGRNGEDFYTYYSAFDDFGNPQVIREVGSDTRTTTVSYLNDPARWILRLKKEETVSDGGVQTLTTARTFDAHANMLSETRAGVTNTFAYTAAGDVASHTNPRGQVTTYSSHHRGIAMLESQPEGVELKRTVNDVGDVTSQTDGENATVGFAFDGLHRVTGITPARGNAVSVAWGPFTRTVTRGNLRETTTYDGFGQPWRVEHSDLGGGDTIVQNYGIDAMGRRFFTSYPNGTTGTGHSFDMLSRPKFVLNEGRIDGTGVVNWKAFQHSSYKTYMTDERNYEWSWSYRAFGDPEKRELMEIATPIVGGDTVMNRNVAGQITSVTQNGVTRSYGYDSRFFLTSVNDPETGVTTMGRDAMGNMVSRQVGSTPSTIYRYDGRNRNTSVIYPAGTAAVTKSYFKDDKLQSVDNGVAQRVYAYDANKNLVSETLSVAGAPSTSPRIFSVGYEYNGNDALSSVTYGSRPSIAYSPDGFGRASRVGTWVTSVNYHPTGQPATYTYGNGITTSVSLDSRRQPQSLNAGRVLQLSYGYDPVGNVTSISDALEASRNRGLVYDPMNRLTGVSGPWGQGAISYDLRGNVLSQSQGEFQLSYNYEATTQRLATVSGSKAYAMQYDGYGNVTSNGSMSFGYDDASNMRCAKCGLPDQTEYDYDGMGQRVRSKKNGSETFFVYGHGGQLLWEETPGGALKEYFYFHGKPVAVKEQALP
jgi:YD repeat-containing protein